VVAGALLGGALLAAVLPGTAGCSKPPPNTSAADPVTRSPVPSPTPHSTPPRALPTIASAVPSSRGPAPFGEAVAVSCAGRPGADQVIALVRRTPDLLPRGATVTVRTGPLCAGTWQFTILSVPEREPLQVVTKGPPGSLTLVTAGTDVCSVEVRTGAPTGILTLAHCS